MLSAVLDRYINNDARCMACVFENTRPKPQPLRGFDTTRKHPHSHHDCFIEDDYLTLILSYADHILLLMMLTHAGV